MRWSICGHAGARTTRTHAEWSRRYPDKTHALGLQYNGEIQRSFQNGWNRGKRITLYPFYPFGDTTDSLRFGTTVLSQGVPPASASDKKWRHSYYAMNNNGGYNDKQESSNGYYPETKPVWVRPHTNPWVAVGTLRKNWDASREKYPVAEFEFGITYNGDIQNVMSNGWNRGERLSLSPIYPIYDDYRSYQFGTVAWIRGCHNCYGGTSGSEWRHTCAWPSPPPAVSQTSEFNDDLHVRLLRRVHSMEQAFLEPSVLIMHSFVYKQGLLCVGGWGGGV